MSLTDELCRSYLDLRWHFDPALGTLEGIREADDRLGRFDAAAVREHLAAFRSIAGAVEELDVDDTADEIDRTALLDEIRVALFRFDLERPHERNPAFWVLHLCEALHGLLLREDDPATLAASALARFRAMPAFLDAAGETLREPASVLVDVALDLSEGLVALVREATERWEALLEPGTLAEAAAGVEDGIARLRTLLRSDLSSEESERAFAAGEDEFDRRLHFEHALAVTAPEAWRYVQRLAEELEAELDALAAEVDPGLPWRAVADALGDSGELLGEDPVGSADGPVEDAVALLEQARTLVTERELATIGPGALAILPLPRYLEVLSPDGAYRPGPMRHGTGSAVLFVGRDGSHTARRMLTVTRGYPGQHLHQLAANALSPQVRRHVMAPVTVEGWALYVADLMAREGWATEPGQRLLDRVEFYRTVLLAAVDVGLHTRNWTPAEATTWLAERLPHATDRLQADVRRICLEPARATAGVLGRRELVRLRDAWCERHGAGFSERAFHDAVLAHGGLPISLIRWGMGIDA